MKFKTAKTSFSLFFAKQATASERFSAEALRRLLRNLPSWNTWLGLRGSRHQSWVAECLRSIAEVVIWGDQHEPKVFKVFRDEAGLERITRILKRKSNRRGPVAAQVLQTVAMLIQNLKDKNALSHVLNHEATRTMISMDFDFNDEDVLGYYVSFVKSIALKLNESTVSSFMKRHPTKSNAFSMPLFSEATKFIDNPERMVRAAARTLTLTIMSLKNDDVDRFLVGDQSRGFLRRLIRNLGNKIEEVQQLKETVEQEGEGTKKCEQLTAEIEDVVCYLNDIYTSGSKGVQVELANAIWDELLGQHLILPLFNAMYDQLTGGLDARAMSEEGLPLLKLPTVETLMSISSTWAPLSESDFHKTIVTTFVTSTMNVLLRRSDFLYSRVIMQLINQTFDDLEITARQRVIPLVNIDLEMLDLNKELGWTIEATAKKTTLAPSSEIEMLEFAEWIGLQTCVDVLRELFLQTKCDKYKPSSVLESLARHPRFLQNGSQPLLQVPSSRNTITSVSSLKPDSFLKPVHRRFSSVAPRSIHHRSRRMESF